MATRIILHGYVQGVGCRAYCSMYARKLGIRGYASNLADGSVEVILITEDPDLIERYASCIAGDPDNFHFFGRINEIKINKFKGYPSGDYSF